MTTRTVLLSLTWPYPVDSGKKAVLRGIVRAVVERPGAGPLTYVHVADRPVDGAAPSNVEYRWVRAPVRREQVRAMIANAATGFSASLQESAFRSRRVAREVQDIVAEVGPALVVFDTFRTVSWLPPERAPAARRVLYMDDLFSVRYARMRTALRADPDVRHHLLGAFADRLPRVARTLLARRGVAATALWLEGSLVRRRESALPSRFQQTLLVSDVEAEALRSRTSGSVMAIPPWLGDVPVGDVGASSPRPMFVTVGDWRLAHNHAGLMAFLREVWPRAKDAMPEVELDVIGLGVEGELEAATDQPGVRVHGFVADLAPHLASARAMVVPLTFGSGVKIKTLDALRTGLPVVTTPVGAEGLRVPPHASFVEVAELGPDFVDAMVRFADADHAAAQRGEVIEFWRATYGDAVLRERYERALFGPP